MDDWLYNINNWGQDCCVSQNSLDLANLLGMYIIGVGNQHSLEYGGVYGMVKICAGQISRGLAI